MFWSFEKEITALVVEQLKRFFNSVKQVINENTEVIEFVNSPRVYEHFFVDLETYPVITVASLGGNVENAGISNIIGQETDFKLGSEPIEIKPINSQERVILKLAPLADQTLDGVSFTLSYPNGPITLQLRTNQNVIQSIEVQTSYRDYYSIFAMFSEPHLITQNSEIVLFSQDPFNLVIDTRRTPLITMIEDQQITGVPIGTLFTGASLIIGGRLNGTVQIKIWSKNSLQIVRDLQALVLTFLDSLKYGQQVKGVINFNKGRTFELKGYHIFNPTVGTVETRPRGDNDRVFVVPVQFNYIGFWEREIPMQRLKELGIQVFSPQMIVTLEV